MTSAGVFTYTACRWRDAVVEAPTLSDLCTAKDGAVDGQLMSFKKNDHVTEGTSVGAVGLVVAVHMILGEQFTAGNGNEDVEQCGFCGRWDGSCDTTPVKAKVISTCPKFSPFWYKHAATKKRNVPRPYPLPL